LINILISGIRMEDQQQPSSSGKAAKKAGTALKSTTAPKAKKAKKATARKSTGHPPLAPPPPKMSIRVARRLGEIEAAKQKAAADKDAYERLEIADTLEILRRHLVMQDTHKRSSLLTALREMCGAPPVFTLPEPWKAVMEVEISDSSESEVESVEKA
jgi:hypothetical protein